MTGVGERLAAKAPEGGRTSAVTEAMADEPGRFARFGDGGLAGLRQFFPPLSSGGRRRNLATASVRVRTCSFS